MSRIRSPWTPPSTDNDGTHQRVLGFDFQADVAITANGAWWFHTGSSLPSTVRALLWLTSDPTTIIADSGAISTTGYTGDAWNLASFASGYACSPNTSYTLAIFSQGSYGYDSSALSSSWTDASGHVTALAHFGRFINDSGAVFPTNTWDGMFGTDLDFTVATASPTPLIVTGPGRISPGGRWQLPPIDTSASSAASANAENATATGTANAPAVDVQVNAGNAIGTGTANDGQAAIAVNAESTTATGTAFDATVSTAAQTSANAENASGTGAANDATSAIAPAAEATSATGTAFDAAVSVSVNAESASGSGSAFSPVADVGAAADFAAATGAAFTAALAIQANAEAAAAFGVAVGASTAGTTVKATSTSAVTAGRTSTAAVTARRTSTGGVT